MKLIFLDIDGVLNCENEIVELTPRGYRGLDDRLICNLKKIVDATGAKIVLTSTWKVEWNRDIRECGMDAAYLINKLINKSLTIKGKTYDDCIWDPYYEHRGEGINAFLCGRSDIESYVIIDDIRFADFDAELLKHLVLTDSNSGLTEETAQKAIDILNLNG